MPNRDSDSGRPLSPERERALDVVREKIGARIRPLLARLPEEQLASLVDRMARIQIKFGGGGAPPTEPPTRPDAP